MSRIPTGASEHAKRNRGLQSSFKEFRVAVLFVERFAILFFLHRAFLLCCSL